MKNNKHILLIFLVGLITITTCKKLEKVMLVSTGEVTNITTNAAEAFGEVIDIGDGATQRGHCYAKNPNVNIDGPKTELGAPTGTGGFTSALTDLESGTKYYIKAYISHGVETVYGKEISFSTISASVPTLSTTAITAITTSTSISGGNITSDGGASVTARGVCWSTTSNPVATGNHTTDGTGSGIFASSITGLTANTTYYVKAYATNSAGTSYGTEITFTTSPATSVVPTLSTTAITAITQTTATSGGNITSDGGASVTARGVCWSLYDGPSTSDPKTSDGFGTGSFTSNITGLTPGTLYHIRAYAINSVGVAYGNEVTFATSVAAPVVPTLTTTVITSISSATASSGGNITSDGGASVTAKGVCWSTSSGPTTADYITTGGSGTGSFVNSLTGLTANTTYYVRAYATNSVGTAYGNEVSFTTDPLTVSDVDGNNYNVIRIGTQLWIKENLKTTKYNDVTSIPNVTDNATWTGLSTDAYCWYNNDATTYKATYGALYNWYAVNAGKLCPTGWHVPTDAEWTTLTGYLINNGYGYEGSGSDIGKSMASTSGWTTDPTAGNVGNDQASNNSSVFTALPSGYRSSNGSYVYIGYCGSWWSSTENSTSDAYVRGMNYNYSDVSRYSNGKQDGFSVRCLRD